MVRMKKYGKCNPNDRIFLGRYKQKTQNALPKNMTIKENIKKERATNSCRDG